VTGRNEQLGVYRFSTNCTRGMYVSAIKVIATKFYAVPILHVINHNACSCELKNIRQEIIYVNSTTHLALFNVFIMYTQYLSYWLIVGRKSILREISGFRSGMYH
jgi:hypothetical protein